MAHRAALPIPLDYQKDTGSWGYGVAVEAAEHAEVVVEAAEHIVEAVAAATIMAAKHVSGPLPPHPSCWSQSLSCCCSREHTVVTAPAPV